MHGASTQVLQTHTMNPRCVSDKRRPESVQGLGEDSGLRRRSTNLARQYGCSCRARGSASSNPRLSPCSRLSGRTQHIADLTQRVSGRSSATQDTRETPLAPRIVTLGGDHTTTLPALRAAFKRWGRISVVHFDAHIGESGLPSRMAVAWLTINSLTDTWDPKVLGGVSTYA